MPPETITKLLAADWTLDKTAFAQYENVLDFSNTLKETDLHAPFQAITARLVLNAHIVLGMSGVDLAEHFWDGKGAAVLSSQYTKLKPDLLSLWVTVPNLAKMRSPLQFKIEKAASSSSVPLFVIFKDSLVPQSQTTSPLSRQLEEISPLVAAKIHRSKKNKKSLIAVSSLHTSKIPSMDLPLDHNSSIASQNLKRP